MSTAIETVQLDNGEAIEIFQDEYPDNPRSWDNLGHILNFHDRYDLGDENTTRSKFEDEIERNTEEPFNLEKWEDVYTYLQEHRGAINILDRKSTRLNSSH